MSETIINLENLSSKFESLCGIITIMDDEVTRIDNPSEGWQKRMAALSDSINELARARKAELDGIVQAAYREK